VRSTVSYCFACFCWLMLATSIAVSGQTEAPGTPAGPSSTSPKFLYFKAGTAKECIGISPTTLDVTFTVTLDGTASLLKFQDAPDPAKRCVAKLLSLYQFAPGTEDGHPVPMVARLVVNTSDAPEPPAIIHSEDPRETCHVAGGWLAAEVNVVIDTQGVPAAEKLAKSSGDACWDQIALATVRKYRFRPSVQHGHPVPCRIKVTMSHQR